jgi:nitroimidazol reductase NimA-like FMN-containing flavoprotein (pyridoxamine 5'-phosphate oxidase superfamily)
MVDKAIDVTGPWDFTQTSVFLRQAEIPIRVASSGSRGPIVQSLWFDFDGDALWCATQASSLLVQRLTANNDIGFEIAADTAPYSGVRGTGTASIHPELAGDVLHRLITKYQGNSETDFSTWLLSRLDKEVAIKINALTLATWDFSGRMGG